MIVCGIVADDAIMESETCQKLNHIHLQVAGQVLDLSQKRGILISLTYFYSVLRTNLSSRITNRKKVCNTDESLCIIQTGALYITDAALCTTDDSVCNTDRRVYALRQLEFVCITEKNCMQGSESGQ